MEYQPPTTDDLNQLKDDLGLSGAQMAELVGLAGGQQWRKYTGGKQPRNMGFHMAFHLAAKLSMPPDDYDQLIKKMKDFGAEVN